MLDLEEAYDLLGASPDHDPEALQRAYRAQVKAWHPDRFHQQEDERAAAEEHMRRINAAYRLILEERRRQAASGPEDHDDDEEDEDDWEEGRDDDFQDTYAADTAEDPGQAGEEADLETDPGREPAPASGDGRAALFWGLLFLLLPLGVSYWHFVYKRTPAAPSPASAISAPPTKEARAPSPALPANRPLIADRIRWVADDFVVDVWHNGRKVPDTARNRLSETFGATSEELTVDLRAGDWLVFNVVNNRMRWGGAKYFAVAGFLGEGPPVFASTSTDARWTFQDDPGKVPEFIRFADEPGRRVERIQNRWDKGDELIRNFSGGAWTGEPVWGGARNTWIKYRAPLP